MESFETDMEKGSTETVIDSSDTATDDEKIVYFPDRQIAKKTLKRVIIGIWIFAAATLIVGIWFVENKLAFVAGDLIGSGIATALMYHLYHCIDVELDIGEVKARAHARWNTMLRFTIEIAAVVGCCFISDYINPIALLIGLFGRKIGAIMVPLFFDKERNGQMTEEDRKQLRTYGRLLSNKEMREMEESEQEAVEGSEKRSDQTPE